MFLGNGLTAIVAGFLGNYLVDGLGLGRVAPFDAASVFMVIGGGVIMSTWTENYGGRLAGWLAGWLAGCCWLDAAGWMLLAGCCWLAGWLAAGWMLLAGWWWWRW